MDGPVPDFGLQTFVSQNWPAHIRLEAWRDILRRKLLRADVDPLQDQPYEAEASLRVLPNMRFGWGRLGAARTQRTRRIIATDNDDLFMVINLDDSLVVSQRRHDFTLRAGDANVMPCAEEASYVRPQAGRIVCVRVARASLAPMVPDIEDNILRVVPRENEALQLLNLYLRALDERQPLQAPEVRERVTAHICDLMALAIGVSRDGHELAARRGLGSARLRAIKTFIGTNLARRDLTVGAIAARMSLTERYVQRLFEAEGTTFTGYLLERRLSEAFEALCDYRWAGRSVSEIAFACGFGDISYFNRAFRRRFGATPSDIRARRAN